MNRRWCWVTDLHEPFEKNASDFPSERAELVFFVLKYGDTEQNSTWSWPEAAGADRDGSGDRLPGGVVPLFL